MDNDYYWMGIALEEARTAYEENEIPVGAVLVRENQLILQNHNRTKQYNNPLAHAEKLLLDAIIATGEKFLYDYTLFVTLEPCCMCAGMIVWSRIGRVVFGAYDAKAGACGSIYQILKEKSFNHHPMIRAGILAEEASALLTQFFKQKR